MANYYDPRRESTQFQVYAAQLQRQRLDKEKEEAEKWKRRKDYGKVAFNLAEGYRRDQMAEAQKLYNIKHEGTKTGRKYRFKEEKADKGLMGWVKHRYRSGEDRVERDYNFKRGYEQEVKDRIEKERVQQLKTSQDTITQKYKDIDKKISLEAESNLQKQLENIDKSYSTRGTPEHMGIMKDVKSKIGYEEPTWKGVNKAAVDSLLKSPEFTIEKPNISASNISPDEKMDALINPYREEAQLYMEAGEIQKGTAEKADKLFETLKGRTSGTGLYLNEEIDYPSAPSNYKPPTTLPNVAPKGPGSSVISSAPIDMEDSTRVPFPDAASITKKNPIQMETIDVVPEVGSKVLEGADTATKAVEATETVSDVSDAADAASGSPGVGTYIQGAQLGAKLLSGDLSGEEKAVAVADTAANIASTKAIQAGIQTGNPYLIGAGVTYKAADFLWDKTGLKDFFA